MAEISILIIRRRFTSPLQTPLGVRSLVYVTYATSQLAPEVMRFTVKDHTPEVEQAVISARVRKRLGITDPEITFTFEEK